MKLKFLLLLLLFLLFSCKKTENQEQKKWIKISSRIEYWQSNSDFVLKSGKYEYPIPNSTLPFKKIILLNASLVGYFTELGLEKNIIGITSPEYIYSEIIQQQIQQNTTQVVGNEAKYDLEKIIALHPDVVMTNHIESFQNAYDMLKKNGIQVIFIDEYLEQKPLEKAKIIELIGTLMGKKEKAESVYKTIEKNYTELKTLAQKSENRPMVIANEMYGNQWYMPGGQTFVAQLLKDAGAHYILANNKDEKAIPMSFEEVFVQAENAQYWVNIGNYSTKASLLTMNPNYQKMKIYQHGKLYAITEKQNQNANDYFEQGVVRADWVLQDYIKIFHPELLPQTKLIFMKSLQ